MKKSDPWADPEVQRAAFEAAKGMAHAAMREAERDEYAARMLLLYARDLQEKQQAEVKRLERRFNDVHDRKIKCQREYAVLRDREVGS